MGRPRKFKRMAVLEAAIALAEDFGYQNITRKQIADVTCTSPATVSNMFGSMDQLKQEVVKCAIAESNLVIFGQALSAKNRLALQASDGLKKAAAEAMCQ